MKKFIACILIVLILALSSVISFATNGENITEKTLSEYQWSNVSRNGDTVYLLITSIRYDSFWKCIAVFRAWGGVKKIVIDLMSYGGSVFDALAMAALIEEEQSRGVTVEIRVRGLAASAALIILVSGSPEHRYVDKNALIMFHELSTFKFFSIETPTMQEEEATINRMLQNKINGYIASKSKISLAELSSMIKKREVWVDAVTAIKLGFADKLI